MFIPRQVEKFWTGTDWEIFLGGDMGGTANQHGKFGKFRKFMGGGTGSKLGWDRFPKIFLGGAILSHPRGTAEVWNWLTYL